MASPRAMCCPGCAAVAQTIVDLGQESYYRDRTAYAHGAGAGTGAAGTAAVRQRPALRGHGSRAAKRYSLVEGIRCAACVWLIERRVLR
jgi:Cu2+-exporting ATPase